MLKLMKLEIKRNNLLPYLYSIGGIYLFVCSMGLLFSAIPKLENTHNLSPFANADFFITMITIVSMACFSILASTMYSTFLVKEYLGTKRILLFSYPQPRSKILTTKILLVSVFSFVAMVLCNIFSLWSIHQIGTKTAIMQLSFDYPYILQKSLSIGIIGSFLSFIACCIGFWKQSVLWTILTAVALIAPLGNGIFLLFQYPNLVIFLLILLFFICGILLIGLQKAVNRMECK